MHISPLRIKSSCLHIDYFRYIVNQLEEYNSCPGVVKMDLVLFKDAIEHICRIVRVISQIRGHMLCVGIGPYYIHSTH